MEGMSDVMEPTSDVCSDHHKSKNKFKLTSFPDYVRKVQQLSFSRSVASNDGKTGSKNLSRAFSCFTTSSNSPNLPCKITDTTKPRLPPLHESRRQHARQLQLKCSDSTGDAGSSCSSPARPIAANHLRTQEVVIQRASSFPTIDCTECSKASTVRKCKRPVMNKSPYLQPLVHKSYYHKETISTDKTKGQRKKRVKQQKDGLAVNTETSEDKQEQNTLLLIPSITLRAATPAANNDDPSTSLADQFTARKQLAAELDKLNREIQDIIVSVEQDQ